MYRISGQGQINVNKPVATSGLYIQVSIMNSSIIGGAGVENNASITYLNLNNGDMRELYTNCTEILPPDA